MPHRSLLFLLLVLIHLFSNLPMEQPMIMADELGYLGNARFLSGRAPLPDMEGARFYHFGYSLLLVPGFWLFSSPIAAYKAALVINALLMSSLFLLLCALIESLFETPKWVTNWIAFICCLYPPLILYSGFAWSESAFVPAYALTAVLLGRYLRSRSSRDAILFALLASLLYTIHPRALPVLVVSISYLLILAALGLVAKRQALAGVTVAGLIFGLTRLGNQYLEGLAWGASGEFSAAQLASRLLPGSQWESLILRAAGQLFYMAISTQGLFLLGLLATIACLLKPVVAGFRRQNLAEPKYGVLLFLVLTGASIFLGSVTLKVYSLFGRDTLRAANFIFGRYNEAFAVLMMAVALAQLWSSRLDRRQRIRQVLPVITAVLILSALVMWQIQTAAKAVDSRVPWLVEATDIAGIYPLVDSFGMTRLYLASLVAIAVLLWLSGLAKRSFSAATGLLVLVFGVSSIYTDRINLQPARKAMADRLSFVPQVERLGPPDTLDYDFAHRDFKVFYGAQFRLQDTGFNRFNSRRGEEPASDVVLGSNGWSQARRLRARFITAAAAGDTALWVLPGETQSALPAPTYLEVNLGVGPSFGIQESGFYPAERIAGVPARWTDGVAKLTVPIDSRFPPRWLEVETIATGRPGVRAQILANDIELWNEEIPETWTHTFSLSEIPPGELLTLELNSDTVNPLLELAGAEDNRNLGVLVKAIRLRTRLTVADPSFLDETLGAEPVEGVLESGFHRPEMFGRRPGRWTTGRAVLTVPVDPQRPPQGLEIEVSAPGRSAARLQIVANGVELWQGGVPNQGKSVTLTLEDPVQEDKLTLELISEPFTPAESLEESTDSRALGVVVHGIRLERGDHP